MVAAGVLLFALLHLSAFVSDFETAYLVLEASMVLDGTKLAYK
jgi:hypothetical protein